MYEIYTPIISDDEIRAYITSSVSEDGSINRVSKAIDLNNIERGDAQYEEIINELTEKKKIAAIIEARDIIMEQLISKFDFSLDEEEIARYSLEIVYTYELLALQYNMSLEEYCENILQIPYSSFFDFCYKKGENEIKEYLVIGAIGYDKYDSSSKEMVEFDEANYQNIENAVYSFFLKVDETF